MTPGQRARLRSSTAQGQALSSFASPVPTPGKVERVRRMAASIDPRIRESAALAHLAPADVLVTLAGDVEVGVRCCVARNERTPPEVLTVLAADVSSTVRGWVAANASAPPALVEVLAVDGEEMVRTVATWAQGWP